MPRRAGARFISGPLAQLVEQLTLNQRVLGSSPRRPTNPPTRVGVYRDVPFGDPPNTIARAEPGLNKERVANVAELVDALDLGSSGATRGSSSLPIRTSPSIRASSTLSITNAA
jgi:hypothetical protein